MSEEMLINAATIAGITIGVLFFVIWFIKSFLKICPPNKVYIFSGRGGTRKVFGGRTIKWPIIETMNELDMTISSVVIKVHGAYSKGGIPLDVQAIANIKLSADPELIDNAIERFLGRSKSEIIRVARETLEGNLRGVISTLTPEQINEDRMEFADRISSDVKHEMDKLGLHLDVFKVQSVGDNTDYLRSLGRKRISEIIREAEVAESNMTNEAKQVEASKNEESQVAQTKAKDVIKQKENELRQIQADLGDKIQQEEEIVSAAARAAAEIASKELQQLKTELQDIKLQVEEVLPARAAQRAAEIIAKGEYALVSEKGKAMAYQIDSMSKVWQYAGEDALPISLMQKIETVLTKAASTVEKLNLQDIHLIDSGDGETISGIVGAYTGMITTIFKSLNDIIGVDLVKSLKQEK
jgi:flotillin